MRLDMAQMERLLQYAGAMPLKRFGLRLALTRMCCLYRMDPSPKTAARCLADLNGILERHADIMEEDYAWIASL